MRSGTVLNAFCRGGQEPRYLKVSGNANTGRGRHRPASQM